MDTLVGTQSSFLLGKWLHDAEALGTTAQEKRYYEKDARNILTTWGGADQSLNDYANRCWSGLLNDFYATRWKMFTHDALNAVRAGDTLDEQAFHKAVTDYEWRWVNQTGSYKDTPSGDAFLISQALYRKYRPEIMAAGAHATTR
jgi:alpha-N-acetylglucosaminidase